MAKKPSIKKIKKILFIVGIIIGLAILCFFVYYFILEKEISFFPFSFLKGTKAPSSALPPTPKGRVGPSPEFLEKIKNVGGKTPSGTEFKGPTAPPPGTSSTIKNTLLVKELKITPSTCTQDCASCPYPLNPTPSWTFEDNNENYQTAFQIQVAENKLFKGPIDSKKIISNQTQCGIPEGCKLPGLLSFNKKYWLRIKIWDSQNKESNWINYSGIYQTPLHLYPRPDFEWSPKTPVLGKEAQFTDLSKTYGGQDGKTEIENGVKTWLWNFSDANTLYSASQNPSVIFEKTPGDKTVTLTITDKDGLYCDASQNVSAIVPLPKYKEGF